MADPKVFEPVKPIGKCGACQKDLFPHSTPTICDHRQDCPLYGDAWRQYQLMRSMQNTYVRVDNA